MIAATYGELLAPLGGGLLVIGWLIPILMAIASVAMVVANRDVDLDLRALPPHEAAAGAGFVLLPAIAALTGSALGIGIEARDVLIALPAMAAVFAVLIHRLTPRSGVADAILLGSVAVSFAMLVVTSFLPSRLSFRHPVESRPALVRALGNTNEPVVLAGGDLVLSISYYAGLKWPDRAVVLADPDLAREAGQPTTDGRLAIAKWTAAAVEPFYPYTAITRSFFVYEAGADWLVPKLRKLNASVEQTATEPGGTLYRVRLR
jgi:hypothetical protein